ncbi:MAG: hypothetical protein PHS62_04020 [Patescibacteria group bacterium]|nr:hypothetical protein [Patescibacteria group bacterium]
MKSKIFFIIIIMGLSASALFSASALPAGAQTNLAQKLSGRILLQVEANGEAWYVNPTDQKKYFLGRPLDAFNLMRGLGVGITDSDLAKIPAAGQTSADTSFAKLQAGKIFLQVQDAGQAWYVNPMDCKKYSLGRPADAWQIMRSLALGITNQNLAQIPTGLLKSLAGPSGAGSANSSPASDASSSQTPPAPAQSSLLEQAAASIRSNDTVKVQSFFIESMRKSIEYSMKHLSAESRLLLANILSGAELTTSGAAEKIYSTKAYFSLKDTEVSLHFHVVKQPDGKWLIANL